jgi:hypothetical protein
MSRRFYKAALFGVRGWGICAAARKGVWRMRRLDRTQGPIGRESRSRSKLAPRSHSGASPSDAVILGALFAEESVSLTFFVANRLRRVARR